MEWSQVRLEVGVIHQLHIRKLLKLGRFRRHILFSSLMGHLLFDLPLEDVVGLTRNFHESIVTSGELGFYRHKRELVLLKDFNLMNAFKWGMEHLVPGEITPGSLIELRKRSIQWFYQKNGDQRMPQDFRLKSEGDVVPIGENLSPQVLERLKHYGIEVNLYSQAEDFPAGIKEKLKKYNLKLHEGAPGFYLIKYPNEKVVKENLAKFADELNKLIKARAPPEYIASFAVQELLLIHPFHDGNGRTARLLGQILYKKLTGKTVIFPREFHKEMNHSREELTKKLMVPVGDKIEFNSAMLRTEDFLSQNKFEDIISYYFTGTGKVPELTTFSLPPAVNVPSTTAAEVPEQVTLGGHNFNYGKLPEGTKRLEPGVNVYFGQGFHDEKSAFGSIKSLFTKGRHRKDGQHVDVSKHVLSTKDYPSSFLQTTLSFRAATGFTHKREVPVVFIIDPQKLPTLKVNELYEHVNANLTLKLHNPYKGEKEILVYKDLPANHILGAIIFDKTMVPQKIMINSHYRHQER